MAFDKDAFHDLLSQHAACIRAYYDGYQRQVFTVHVYPGCPAPCETSAAGLFDPTMSAHRRLVRTPFLKKVRQTTLALDALIRDQFPALDAPNLSVKVDVGLPGTRGERMTVGLQGREDPMTMLPTVLKRLEVLHDRLAPVRKPDTQYMINDIPVWGASPREALRTFLALHRPDLFGVKTPDRDNRFIVSAVCETSAAEAIADW